MIFSRNIKYCVLQIPYYKVLHITDNLHKILRATDRLPYVDLRATDRLPYVGLYHQIQCVILDVSIER